MVTFSRPEPPVAAPSRTPAGAAVRTGRTATVALLADIPTTGQLGDTCARRFALPGDSRRMFSPKATGTVSLDTSAEFIDFATDRVGAGQKVIALYPAWRAETAERTIHFARGALRTDHIAAVSLDLSPLAVSLLADQLAYLAPYLSAGVTAAMASELPKHMLAGAWLRSVGSLATLPTSVSQHLGSYVPGVAFMAYCAPEQRVIQVRHGADLAENIPHHPREPVQLLYTVPESLRTTFLDDQLLPALNPDRSLPLPPQQLAAEYWGTPAHIEFVAFSAHPRALSDSLTELVSTLCTWCRERITTRVCPFCHAANRPPRREPRPTALRVPHPRRHGVEVSASGAASNAYDPAHTSEEPEQRTRLEPSPLPACPPPDAPSEPVPASLGDRMDAIRLRARESQAPLPSLSERLPDPPESAPATHPQNHSDQAIRHRIPPSALPMAPNGHRGSHPLNADSEPSAAYDLPVSPENTFTQRTTQPSPPEQPHATKM
ncbi:hypothetical protein GCM10009799_32670 [Nocardiopsis rhodophaea]|uniref:Uncharacterized protein n=1 Tax=Nocardiopsis rhodophaea TaxID=280238 RepID=A0ABP5EQ93_9ACTN